MEPSKLVALFVFNPQLGGEMTEGKKILYFYPRTPLNVQKQYVGVSEGMIQFCRCVRPPPWHPDQPDRPWQRPDSNTALLLFPLPSPQRFLRRRSSTHGAQPEAPLQLPALRTKLLDGSRGLESSEALKEPEGRGRDPR